MPPPLRNIEAVRRPCTVIAGLDDDLFYTDSLEPIFRSLGQS